MGETVADRSAAFAGHEKALVQLNSFLWPALAGQGKVVFVTADHDGCAFVEGVLRHVQTLHPAVTVALSTCRQDEAPYLPWAEILRLLASEAEDLQDGALSPENAGRLQALHRGSTALLTEFAPELLDSMVPEAAQAASETSDDSGSRSWFARFRQRSPEASRRPAVDEEQLFEEYGAVLAEIARRQPLVLGLFGLHRADEGTIRLLPDLAKRIVHVPVFVVGTYQPDALAAPAEAKQHALTAAVDEITRFYAPITIPLDAPVAVPRPRRDEVPRESRPAPPIDVEAADVGAPAADATPATEAAREVITSDESRPVFVGRERELGQLQSFLDASLTGSGQVVFVTGEPGAGKSTLIREFVYRAQQQHENLVVAVGDCNAQTGASDAYLPFREVMTMLTGGVESSQSDETLSPDNANRIESLLKWSGEALLELGPDLIDIFVPGSGLLVRGTTMLAGRVGWMDKLGQRIQRREEHPDVGQEELDQSHLFEQYTNVVGKVAERTPLVLVLDDLQWADEASIALLFHLGRRIVDSRVFIIGTYRPNDVALGRDGKRHPLESVVTELKRYYARIEINLTQVTASEEQGASFVSDYVDAAYAPHRLDQGFKTLIFKRTRGHALFTVELLYDLQERGVLARGEDGVWHQTRPVQVEELPARVDAVIGERITRLEAELRDILTTASVEGEDFTAQVVAQVQDLDDRRLAKVLTRELDRQHHLVSERGLDRVDSRQLFLWRFRNALFQDHVYRDLSAMERAMLHEDVGEALETLYGEEVEQVAVQLARHFLEAGVYGKAFKYLKMAGEHSKAQYAHDEAVDSFRKALQVAEEIPDDVRRERVETHENLGDVLVDSGAYDQALANYTAALDLAQQIQWPDDAAQRMAALHRKVGMVHERKGEYETALKWLDQARELLAGESSSELVRVYTAMAGILHRQGEAAEALDWCQQGIDIAQAAGLQDVLAHVYLLRGAVHSALGSLDKAIDDCRASLKIAERIENLPQQAKANNNLAVRYYYKGDWDQAVVHYRKSLEIRERIGDVNGMATVSNNLGEIYLIQGQFDAAGECFQRCLETWGETGFQVGVAIAHRNLGQICLKQEAWDEALEHLKTSRQILEDMGARDWLMAEVYRHLAEVYLGLGVCEPAWRYCERALNIAQIQELKLVEGSARRVMGQVHRCQDELDKAEVWLLQGLDLLEQQDLPYETGQALMDLAQLYRDRSDGHSEDVAKAVGMLERAIAVFEGLGAQWDLTQAQSLKGELNTTRGKNGDDVVDFQ